MGVLYRYDYIREGLSKPKVLSFRLTIQILEEHYNQISDYAPDDAAPTTCFLSQMYAKKWGDSYYLVLTVNLTSFYEKWTNSDDKFDYDRIVYLLEEKLKSHFGETFAKACVNELNLDCDFIEYSCLAEGRNITTRMLEAHADSDQVYKTHWDEYLKGYAASIKKIKQAEEEFNRTHNENERTPYTPFMLGITDHEYEVDDELYIRCYGPMLQEFLSNIDKVEAVEKRGVLLKYLFDENIQRTICQCAYEYNCLRSVPDSKLIYNEYCTKFEDPE